MTMNESKSKWCLNSNQPRTNTNTQTFVKSIQTMFDNGSISVYVCVCVFQTNTFQMEQKKTKTKKQTKLSNEYRGKKITSLVNNIFDSIQPIIVVVIAIHTNND